MYGEPIVNSSIHLSNSSQQLNWVVSVLISDSFRISQDLSVWPQTWRRQRFKAVLRSSLNIYVTGVETG